ncbi:Stability/partitioning determinant, partial [Pseudomonas savastanoi]
NSPSLPRWHDSNKRVSEKPGAVQLRVALQIARDDFEDRRERQRQGIVLAKSAGLYRGRKPNAKVHEQIIALKGGGCSIAETARLAGVSVSQVKRVWSQYLAAKADV